MEKMRLMLVDDEERFLNTTKKVLQKQGVNAITAISGEEALLFMVQGEIDVVILDVKMPGMDGIQTLREIKKRFPMTEVIMLTGHASVESAVDGLKSGAVDYILKPTGVEDLLEKANEAFQRKRALEEKIRMAQARGYMKSPRNILGKK